MRQATIRVAQPCQENWAAMTPTAAGRHCAACAAEVIDFTLKTDAEILAHLAKAAGGRTCGRFAAGQLERPLQRAVPATPTARWRAWLAAAVAVWGLRETIGTEAKAQAPIEMRKMGEAKAVPEHSRAAVKPDCTDHSTESQLRGTVVDARTHEGIPGVTVSIKGTTIGVQTNADGHFELRVPEELSGKVVTLVYNSIGYMTVEQWMKADAASQVITLPLNAQVLGGYYYIEPVVPPAPWHPRRLYNWGKYWVMRPFRGW